MSIEYKNRGVLHKIVNVTKFKPHQSKNTLVRLTAKAVLAAETTVLFAKDLATNRLVGKEFHIKFERKVGKNGKYKTHIKLVRAEAPVQLPKGILHKIDRMGRFFEGDVPFRSKPKIEFKPKTITGKIVYHGIAKPLAYGTKFHVKNAVKLTKSTALAAESAAIQAGSAGVSLLARHLRMNANVDTGGKTAMTGITTVMTVHRAWKYLVTYRKKRVRFKELKQSYKGKVSGSQAAKNSLKSVKQKNKPEINQHRLKRIKVVVTHAKKAIKNPQSVSAQIKSGAAKQIVLKSKIKYKKQLIKSEKKIVQNKKKLQKLAKKQMNKERVMPVAAVPILVPSAFVLDKIQQKSKEKILTSDPNNDFVQAIDKTERLVKGVNQVTKPIKNKLQEKHTQAKSDRLHKRENRLKEKNTDLKKNKRKKIKHNQKKLSERFKEAAEKAAKQAKKAIGDFTKFAFKMFGILLVPILGVFLCFCIVLLMFTGSAGHSSYILGTYNAADKDLSYAVEHYTKIAYEYNQKILKCGDSETWKSGLEEFDIDTSGYNDTPNQFKFGKSSKYTTEPYYDFDADKLAAFMCAYYYEHDDDGKIKNWEWNDSYDEVLQKLFDTEYTFKHYYEDYSGWKKLSSYVFYNGGGSEGYSYNTVYTEGMTKSKMKVRGVPSVIENFCDDNGYMHYDYDTLEVLDANNDDERTGYFIQDQRYIVKDSNGNQNYPFYSTLSADYNTEIKKYVYSSDGLIHYRKYGTKGIILKEDGKETNYYIADTTVADADFEYRKYVWKHGTESNGNPHYENRSSWIWTSDQTQIFCVVTPANTVKWNSSLEDICLINFYQKNYWYDNCCLYYTVKNKCTFEEAIIKVLKDKNDNTEGRLQFYYTLTQETEEGNQTYGNHQMLNAPVKGKSLSKISSSIYNSYGYDMQEWNEQHCSISDFHNGIDIAAAPGLSVYAMCDGYVNWIDSDKRSMSIMTSKDLTFWYEDNAKYPLEIIYANISTTLNTGDEFKQGDVIGTVTNHRHCYDGGTDLYNPDSTKYYLHIVVKVNGEDNDVNPIYMIYRNENEAR